MLGAPMRLMGDLYAIWGTVSSRRNAAGGRTCGRGFEAWLGLMPQEFPDSRDVPSACRDHYAH